MKKLLLVGGIVLVLLVGFIVIRKSQQTASPDGADNANEATSGEVSTPPQIEIVTASAYLINSDGSRGKELKDNDAVTPPATIEVSSGGEAILHFSDGSLARIAAGTKFSIKQADYDTKTGKSNVSIFVSIGQVWSKVVELATPDSSWNVETSNAVATVRGTAFNTEADAEGSTFTGSEHEVDITPLDPDTHEPIVNASTSVKENTYVDIRNAKLKTIIAKHERLIRLLLTDTQKRQDWVKNNQNQDTKVNDFIQKLKDEGLDAGALRLRLKMELREKIREELRNSTTTPPRPIATSTPTRTPTSTPSTAKAVSLELTARGALVSGISEGDTVQFKATAKLADGTFRDVTAKVKWQVLGDIGTVSSGGLFTARLGDEISEAGQGSGTVIAILSDGAGNDLLGKSIIFKVSARTDEIIPDPTGA